MSAFLVSGYSCREGYSDNEKKSFYSIPVCYALTVFSAVSNNPRDDSKRSGNNIHGAGCVAISELSISSRFFKQFETEFLTKFNGYPVLMELETELTRDGSTRVVGFSGYLSPLQQMFAEFGGQKIGDLNANENLNQNQNQTQNGSKAPAGFIPKEPIQKNASTATPNQT